MENFSLLNAASSTIQWQSREENCAFCWRNQSSLFPFGMFLLSSRFSYSYPYFFLSLSDSFSSFSLFIFLSIESINCNCNLLEKYLHVNALHLSVPIDFIRSISFRFHTDNEEAKKVEETKKLRKKMHFLYYFLLFHFHSFDSLRGIFVSILKCRSMFEKKKTIATKRKYWNRNCCCNFSKHSPETILNVHCDDGRASDSTVLIETEPTLNWTAPTITTDSEVTRRRRIRVRSTSRASHSIRCGIRSRCDNSSFVAVTCTLS